MKKRIIPTKNYVIFGIVSLLSFALVYNLGQWYKDAISKEIIMTTVITEVLGDEFDEFIIENSNVVVYMASSEDDLYDFEVEFKKYIVKEGLQGEIVYFDISKYEKETFYQEFTPKYFNQTLLEANKQLEVFPNILVFKEHKVTNMLYDMQIDININDVAIFIENAEVME